MSFLVQPPFGRHYGHTYYPISRVLSLITSVHYTVNTYLFASNHLYDNRRLNDLFTEFEWYSDAPLWPGSLDYDDNREGTHLWGHMEIDASALPHGSDYAGWCCHYVHRRWQMDDGTKLKEVLMHDHAYLTFDRESGALLAHGARLGLLPGGPEEYNFLFAHEFGEKIWADKLPYEDACKLVRSHEFRFIGFDKITGQAKTHGMKRSDILNCDEIDIIWCDMAGPYIWAEKLSFDRAKNLMATIFECKSSANKQATTS